MKDLREQSRELYLRLLSYVRRNAKVFALALLGMIGAAATEPLVPALMKPLLDGGFAAARGATAGKTYTVKPGEGFGIQAAAGVILGCQVLNVTSKQLAPIYRGVKVSCWFATSTKAVPNRYGISISDKFAGVFKITPQGAMSTWGYVKQQPT